MLFCVLWFFLVINKENKGSKKNKESKEKYYHEVFYFEKISAKR